MSAKKGEEYQLLKTGIIPSVILDEIHRKAIERGQHHLYHYETDRIVGTIPKPTVRTQILFCVYPHKEKGVLTDENSSMYDKSRYKFFVDAPFEISNMCCKIMKKQPVHKYHSKTGRVPFTAQMADESRLRQTHWLKNGCNGFDMKIPLSNPMSFWTENDVLEYIVKTGIPICSVYGNIVEDYGEQLEGQISLADYGLCEKKCKYKCTGCKRTGCVLCGYGAHLESKEESRFRKLKVSHPKFYGLLDLIKNNGVTFREAIEWTNEHLGKNKIWL